MKLRRRRWLILIALLLSGVMISGVLLKNYLTNQLRLFLEAKLSTELAGPVTIHGLSLSMTRPTLEIQGIKLSSDKYGIDDLSIVQVRMRFNPLPIFFGQIYISEIEIGDTSVQLITPLPGTVPIKKKASRDGWLGWLPEKFSLPDLPGRLRLIEFIFERIHLPQVQLRISHLEQHREKWQLNLELRNLESRLRKSGRLQFSLAGSGMMHLVMKGTTKDTQADFTLEEIQSALTINEDGLRLDKLAVVIEQSKLEAKGVLFPKPDLQASVSFPMATLSRYLKLYTKGYKILENPLRGELALTAHISNPNTNDPTAIQMDGTVSMKQLQIADSYIGEIRSGFLVSPKMLRVKSLELPGVQGSIDTKAQLDFNSGDFQANLKLSQFPTESLATLIKPLWRTLPNSSGSLNGDLSMKGRLTSDRTSTNLQIATNLQADSIKISGKSWQTTLQGFSIQSQITSTNQLQEWQVNSLQILSQQLTVNGQGFYRDNEFDMTISGTADNGWQHLHPSLEKLFGKVSFSGTFGAAEGKRQANLRLSGNNFRVGNDDGWLLQADFILDNDQLTCRDFSLHRQQHYLRAQSQIDLSKKTFKKTTLSMQDMPAEFPIAFLPAAADIRELISKHVDGTISGEINADGPFQSLNGSAAVDVTKIRVFDEDLDSLSFKGDFAAGLYRVNQLRLKKEKGLIDAQGEIDANRGTMNLRWETANLDTLYFKKLKRFVPKSHPILMVGKLTGSLTSPTIEMQMQLLNDGEPLLNAALSGPVKQPSASISLANNPSTLKIDFQKNTQVTGKFVNFDPFQLATYLGHRLYSDIGGTFSGNVDLYTENNNYQGKINLHSIHVKQGAIDLLQRSRLELDLINNNLFLRDCMLQGFSSYFQCKENQTLEGHLNLALLRTFFDFVSRSEGQVYVRAQGIGPITNFNFDGAVNITNGTLNFKGFPTLLENVQVNAVVHNRQITVNRFSTQANEGTVVGKGSMLVGPKWDRIDFDLVADANSFPVRIPEDFPGNASGRLTFTGPGTDALMKGDFKINSLRYTKRFDWRSRLLDFGGKVRRSINTSLVKEKVAPGRGVNFDLHFTAAEPVISVKNNVGDILLTGDFAVLGKIPNVGIEGVFNVSSGKVQLRNQIFTIDSGTLNFNRKSLNPTFDVYASAKVKEFNVNVNIRTVNDEVRVDMTSNPPLSETDLLSLITVGSVTSAYANVGAQQSGVTQGLAVGLVSGSLQDKFERIGLLDSFEVIPDYSQISKTTQLRLMLGKDITKDLGLIYSTDLYNAGANQEVRLRQNVNRNFSVLGAVKNTEVNQNVDLGVDFEFSFDF